MGRAHEFGLYPKMSGTEAIVFGRVKKCIRQVMKSRRPQL